MMTKIKVYDAIMGNSKTEKIINDLVNETRPVIVITPLLSEVERISGAIVSDTGVHMKDDNGYLMYQDKHRLAHKQFLLPNSKNSDGSKLTSIKSLIEDRRNICSTHKLFSMFDLDIIEAIKKHQYLLVVDESLEVWSNFKLYYEQDDSLSNEREESENKGLTRTDKEIQALINGGFIEVDPLGLLWWQDDKFPNANKTFYKEVKRLCDLKQLYISNGRVVFWELNHTVLSAFSEVTLATYMFEYSFMRHYLLVHGFDYTVEHFGLKPCDYKKHVTIVDGKMNTVGDKNYSLSYSDLTGRKDRGVDPEVLKNHMFNFFYNKHGVKPKGNNYVWTTYKKAVPKISGGRYKTGWIAYNTKATNDYIGAEYVCYICNNFPSTYLEQMVTKRSGAEFNKDMWALSEMLQMLFRSKIRMLKDETRMIHFYIPSKRMRMLFQWWLEQDTHEIGNYKFDTTKYKVVKVIDSDK